MAWPARSRLLALLLGAALAACATPARRELRVPHPLLPPPAVVIERLPISIATSVEHVDPVLLGSAFRETLVVPVDEPLRAAFEAVAASLSSVDPAVISSLTGPDATLSVRTGTFNVVPPLQLELESALVARDGRVLASVTRSGWGPDRERYRDEHAELFPGDLSAAIASAAAKTRDALAVAPELAALRPTTPTPTPTPISTSTSTPDLRPRITGFLDLRWPAERDPVVAARMETLSSRRTWAKTLALAGVACLTGAALAMVPRKDCSYGACTEGRVTQPELAAGFGIAAAISFAAAAAVWPWGATRDLVELWNGRHPDRPLEVAPPPPISADQPP